MKLSIKSKCCYYDDYYYHYYHYRYHYYCPSKRLSKTRCAQPCQQPRSQVEPTSSNTSSTSLRNHWPNTELTGSSNSNNKSSAWTTAENTGPHPKTPASDRSYRGTMQVHGTSLRALRLIFEIAPRVGTSHLPRVSDRGQPEKPSRSPRLTFVPRAMNRNWNWIWLNWNWNLLMFLAIFLLVFGFR